MDCQGCGNPVPDGAQTCPNCGAAVQQPPRGTGQGAQSTGSQSQAQPQGGRQQGQTQPQGGRQQGQTQPQGGRQQTQARNRPQADRHQAQPPAQGTGAGQTADGLDLRSNVAIVGGIIYGAVAFTVSFLITSVFVYTDLEREANNIGASAGDEILALLGWFLYNAHTVAVTATTTDESVNLLETAYQNAGSALAVPKIAYYIVPVAVLFLLAYTLANRATSADTRPAEAAIAGASIALGYGILAYFGGSTVFTVSEAGESIGPEMGTVFVMMCLVYPVFIGGVAGYLARR